MKALKKIRILGIDYKVDLVVPNMGSRNSDLGNVDNYACEIRIDTVNNSPDHAKSVVLHEIIEAINYRLELKLEHKQITALEGGLFAVIMDNPDLIVFLMQEDANEN